VCSLFTLVMIMASEILGPAGISQARRFAFVLWSAEIGGAETMMLALAERFRRFGAEPEFVIIGHEGPLVERLAKAGLRFRILGFARGSDVLRFPRRYARAVARSGTEGALLPENGFIGLALRLGGYNGPVVAVEHGALQFSSPGRIRRILERAARAGGAWADDAEVAVSDFVLCGMRRHPHARLLRRIYNGVDPDAFVRGVEPEQPEGNDEIVTGFVGRLVPGKGLDILIRAVAEARKQVSATLLVAGDGPERARLSAIVRDADLSGHVQLLGMVDDVSEFWRQCDIAIVPSDTSESFCMAALEAMACGKPVLATRTGALPELIVDGETGILVPPRNVDGLMRAIVSYAERPYLRREHAVAARSRAVSRFHLDDTAQAYMDLFAEIVRSPHRRRSASLTASWRLKPYL
jgi:glycosyltransferase involved in cell wall biosynthesis